jgi:branched-chain amino acid transport system permease protein
MVATRPLRRASLLDRVPAAVDGLRSASGTGLLATAFMLGVVELFPHPMSAGVYLSTGVVFGAWVALVTLGLVLVFRSSRVINFAAFQVGATPAILFYEVVHKHSFARLLTGHLTGRQLFPRWALTTEYWLAALLAVVVAALLSALTYLLVVRRLATAPPLVGTVATVAVSALLSALTVLALNRMLSDAAVPSGIAPPPQDVQLSFGGGSFNLGALLTLGVAALALPAVELYLRRSRVGTGVRAAADNPDRAATLGVNSASVTTRVWMIAGALSGVAAVLTVMTSGPAAVAGTGGVVPMLVALVLAGMVGLRVGFVAAVGTGVLSGGLLWSFQASALVYPVLLAVVVVALLARRRATSRVGDDEVAWQAAREARPVPVELRGNPEVRRMRVWVAVVAVAVIGLFPFVTSVGAVGVGTGVAIDAMVGLSLLVLTGWAGLISLGQFALAVVGGWLVAVLGGAHHLSALLTLPLAAIGGAVVAFVVGLPALRVRGIYLAVLTLAFASSVDTLLLQPDYGGRALPDNIPRPSLFGLSTDGPRPFYFVCVAFVGLTLLAVAGLRRSRAGRALIASRENEKYAELFGVRLVSARLQAFALSGAIASVAGGLFAYEQQSVSVGNFGPEVSLTMLLIVIVGGMGAQIGPVLGAVLIGVLSQLGDIPSTVGLPVAVLVVLLAMPGGLAQFVFHLRDMMLRRIAFRARIVVPSLVDAAHPAWSADAKIPLAGTDKFVPERYTLAHQPLSVPKVAATGRGA